MKIEYSERKYMNEWYLRKRRINPEYPVLFNRINWDMVEDCAGELCEFQRTHDDLIPPTLLLPTNVWDSFYEVLCNDEEKLGEYLVLKRSRRMISYDIVYEFIQKYPEWSKLVYYDENPNDIYDEFLTIHINTNIPYEFNRINWQKVDEKIDRIYEIFMNQKEKVTVPIRLFLNFQEVEEVSKHYKEVSKKMWEYFYEECLEKKNPIFDGYGYNQDFNTYDGYYNFIKEYPELSDIVYFDPDKE